jgi:phasin
MSSPKLEVPVELREIAEKTMEQAEKAFGMFLDAAKKSIESIPNPTTEMSNKALSFTEEHMKAAFDHAKKVIRTTNLQEAMQVQSEFLKNQFTSASEQIKKITGEVMSAAKDATKDKS